MSLPGEHPEALDHLRAIQAEGIDRVANLLELEDSSPIERSGPVRANGRTLTRTHFVETKFLAFSPEEADPNLSSEGFRVIKRTEATYERSRLARFLGSTSTDGLEPVNSTTYWHIPLGLQSGQPEDPHDMLEEIKDIPHTIIPEAPIVEAHGPVADSVRTFAGYAARAQAAAVKQLRVPQTVEIAI